MKNVTVTLLGAGYIGRVHMTGYLSLPLCYPGDGQRAALKNLVTRRPEGPEAALFENAAREIGQVGATDIADICTPNFLHAEEITDLADRGFRCIYCEKPVTGFYPSEREMSLFARARRLLNQTALVYRFLPALIRARRLVEEGVIGTLVHFQCSLYHGSYLDPSRPMSWRLRREYSGGGALVDLGIHALDALGYAAGDITGAAGYVRTLIETRPDGNGTGRVDVDDFAHLKLRIGEARGTAEVSRVTAGADGNLRIDLYGTKGAVRLSSAQPEQPMVFRTEKGIWEDGAAYAFPETEADIALLWPSAKYSLGTMQNMHMASVRCLLKRVAGEEFHYIEAPQFEDSARAMQIIDGIYQNGRFEA